MAEPKKKLSKTRTHLRRSTIRLAQPSGVACSHCGEVIRAHQICDHCGYYRGKLMRKKAPSTSGPDSQNETEEKKN